MLGGSEAQNAIRVDRIGTEGRVHTSNRIMDTDRVEIVLNGLEFRKPIRPCFYHEDRTWSRTVTIR